METQALNGLQITSAEDFAPEEYKLQLPSGRVLMVREVDLIALLSNGEGDIPDFLSGYIEAKLLGKSVKEPEINKENLPEFFNFVHYIIPAGVVSHKVVKANANRQAGEININDLNPNDKIVLFNTVMPLEALTALSFRQRVEAANMETVRGGTGDGNAPKRNRRAKK
jgi:hypothetical protein